MALAISLTVAVLVAGPVAAGGAGLPRTLAVLAPASDAYTLRFMLPRAGPAEPRAASPVHAPPPLSTVEVRPAKPRQETSAPLPRERLTALTAGPAEPRALDPRQPSRTPGVIALRYSLAGGAEAGDAIEVAKPVSVGGKDAGRLPIRIDGNARVFAQASGVAAVLSAHGASPPTGLGDAFVSLEELRGLGIDVRYDAVRDRLILAAPEV
jgi:hypothetical protein